MRIYLNGESVETRNTVLADVLNEHGFKSDSIATAVNEVFIHKQQRGDLVLKQDDRVEVVAPMAGG